jgi:hypothetical protein
MQISSRRQPRLAVMLLAGVLALSTSADARDKKAKAPDRESQDEIEVAGHVAVTGGPVTRLLATRHYSSYYLYAEREPGNTVTLLDVTRVTQPQVLSDVAYPSSQGSASLMVVAGTAALVTGEPSASRGASPTPTTIRIMDFSDPRHPKVAREFAGVTATSRDESRGLIFIANGDGVWILHQRFATDPEVERAYAHHVLYDH